MTLRLPGAGRSPEAVEVNTGRWAHSPVEDSPEGHPGDTVAEEVWHSPRHPEEEPADAGREAYLPDLRATSDTPRLAHRSAARNPHLVGLDLGRSLGHPSEPEESGLRRKSEPAAGTEDTEAAAAGTEVAHPAEDQAAGTVAVDLGAAELQHSPPHGDKLLPTLPDCSG